MKSSENKLAYMQKYRSTRRQILSGETRAWRLANPMKTRTNNLKKFGMTAIEYDEMHTRQNGVCAICFQPETRLWRKDLPTRLAVDHNHATGVTRSLLCSACNTALGLFGDSVDRLRSATNYLEYHSWGDID